MYLFPGSGGGFYQWSRGVQIRANLDLLMDWTHSIGLGDLAAEFFQKLSSAVNLLATPKETLLQVIQLYAFSNFPQMKTGYANLCTLVFAHSKYICCLQSPDRPICLVFRSCL